MTLNESEILSAGKTVLVGEYRVEVILRDSSNAVLDTFAETFTVQAIPEPPPPTLPEVLAGSPILVVAFVIALIVLVVFLLRFRSGNNKEDPLGSYGGGVPPGGDLPPSHICVKLRQRIVMKNGH